MLLNKAKNFYITLSILLFVCYLVWWVYLYLFVHDLTSAQDLFTDTYGIVAGLGGVIGLIIAKKWGGFSSFVGKSLSFFSLGLLAQFAGQLSYTILFYVYHIENAYPSFGEVFYLASIPLYISGVWYIGRASGLSLSIKKLGNAALAFLLPLLMLSVSYYFFLKDYDSTGATKIQIFLDFFYPLGQSIFVSSAIVVYLLTDKLLFGVMKKRVALIVFSLIFQYVADSLFIYETQSNTWNPAGHSDLAFLISYFLMTLGLLYCDSAFEGLKRVQPKG